MPASQPRLRSLLRQAAKVADSGKRTAAEKLYRQILSEAPESVEAWLGIAAITPNETQKKEAFEQALALDSENEAALLGLSRLRGELLPATAEPIQESGAEVDPFEQSREWLQQTTAPLAKPVQVADESNPAPDPPVATAGQPEHDHDVEPADEESYDLVCYRHPSRETSLRCYSCSRPICSECAVKTPVGYRCPTCIREAEEVFFNARTLDYILAPLVSLPLSLVAGFLVRAFGRGFFFVLIILFVGGAVGGLIGRIAKRVVDHRRGRYLPHVVASTVILGIIIPTLPLLIAIAMGNTGYLGSLLMPGVYLFVATGAAFHQMK